MSQKASIRVLVVEDSAVVREFLVAVLEADPDIHVAGTARDGEEAIEAVPRLRPDAITMDIHMPRMDGLEATRRIMETCPTPIVIVSGSTDWREVVTSFDAIEAGALAVLRRPPGPGHPDCAPAVAELVQTVKLMAEVKVVRRWPRPPAAHPRAPAMGLAAESSKIGIVAIGASTGGPPVLHGILAALPRDFPAPVAIVQHMATGFIGGFAEWLAQTSPMPVHLAANGQSLLPGHIYIAPDGHQMTVARGGRVALTDGAPEHGLRPSASCLFRSIAEIYGGEAIAGLLTGMGRDGAEELKLLKDRGAITFVQDKESSVVHGMAGEAIRLDAAMLVLPAERIAPALVNLASRRNGKGANS